MSSSVPVHEEKRFVHGVFAAFIDAINTNVQLALSLCPSDESADGGQKGGEKVEEDFSRLFRLFGVMSKYDLPYFIYGLTYWRRTSIEGRCIPRERSPKRKSLVNKVLEKQFGFEWNWLSSHLPAALHRSVAAGGRCHTRKQVS